MAQSIPTPIATGEILLKPGTSYVYLAYDAAGELLYVGVTDNLTLRLAQHARTSIWHASARRITWQQFPNRTIADRVERKLIASLCPEHNVTHNGPRIIARSMGHRRLYPTAAWRRLGETVRAERGRLHRSQRSIAYDGDLDLDVLREVEHGEQTRYPLHVLLGVERGLSWRHGSIEAILAGGEPGRLTAGERMQRAHAAVDRVNVMGGI